MPEKGPSMFLDCDQAVPRRGLCQRIREPDCRQTDHRRSGEGSVGAKGDCSPAQSLWQCPANRLKRVLTRPYHQPEIELCGHSVRPDPWPKVRGLLAAAWARAVTASAWTIRIRRLRSS